jgi:cellulose synthase (UDP-forming)
MMRTTMTNPTSAFDLPKSFPRNSRSRLLKRTLLFRYLAEINLILGAWYLQWRITHSINFDALWLSIPLLVAEIYSYIGGAIFTIGLWRPLERQIKSLDSLSPPLPPSEYPTVDIFITCYNEPPEMVAETAQAALAIDYPVTKSRVYILDDGNSPEMRSLAQRLCLEDLQTPAIREQAERIKSERHALREQLQELRLLSQDIPTAEAFLTSANPEDNSGTSANFARLFRNLFVVTNPEGISIQDLLMAKEEQLVAAIKQKELALTDLARCRYIARPKPEGKAHYAKAGNINYALFAGETSGNFILTLDADHIPKPQFLKRVLPYFYTYNIWTGKYDGNLVAIVQTPQDFYNIPNGDPFCHRAHLFYGAIQQGKDGLNSAFYTGTNAVLRREALVNVGLKYFSQALAKDQSRIAEFTLIGGVSSTSITEDMNTAMRLHGAGWKTVYHNELLAEGLAPDDLSSTLQQRLRWAQGTIQVLVQENPWTKPGLTFWQRLQYFQTMYSYFSGFATLILITCPIVFFFTGITPVNTFGPDFVIHFVPAFIMNRIVFLTVAWGISAQEIWRCEQYATALFPLFIQSVVSVFTKRKLHFKVTPKQRQSGIYLRLVMPQITIFCLSILGILWSIALFLLGKLDNPGIYLLNAGWAIYNMSLLWGIIRASFWQPKHN